MAKCRRCSMCKRPIEVGAVCERCRAQMAARFPPEPKTEKENTEDIMAKKTAAKVKIEEPNDDIPFGADEEVIAEDGIEVEQEPEDDVEEEKDAPESEDAAEDSDEDEAEEEESDDAPISQRLAKRRAKNRRNARMACRAISVAVSRLEFFDWEGIGEAGGIRGAIAMLKNGLPKVEDAARTRKATGGIVTGSTVRIKNDKWDDILAEEDRSNLRVVELKGKMVKVATHADERLFIPAKDLEVQR